MSLNMNDAGVALRSFGRRYGEVVNGPVGDDGWDRKVRAVPESGASALAHVLVATEYLRALTKALMALQTTKDPVMTTPRLTEPATGADSKKLVADLKAAGTAAGEALDAKSHDDYERTVKLDAELVEVRSAVETVVKRCVAGLTLAEQSIEAAP